MTSLSILRPLPEGAAVQSVGRRTAVYVAAFAAATAGVIAGQVHAQGADTRGMEQSLISLLRFMAALKAVAAIVMLALTQWRLTRPAAGGVALTYGAAVILAAAAPGLIWSPSSVALGAVLFHVGLLTFMIVAWRDDAVELKFRH